MAAHFRTGEKQIMRRRKGIGIIAAVFVVSTAASVMGLTSAVPGGQDYGPLTEEMITEEMIATGGGMFNSSSCQRCHMQGGQGGGRGPALTDEEWLHSDGNPEGIRSTIISGVAEDEFKGGEYPYPMHAMGGMDLDEEGLNALAAYVWSLSRE